jgi:hypothetical protein
MVAMFFTSYSITIFRCFNDFPIATNPLLRNTFPLKLKLVGKMIRYLCCMALLITSVKAEEIQRSEYSSEHFVVNKNLIHVISSFDQVDYFSTFLHSGDMVWEIPFNSQILSMKIYNEGLLYIFSKQRNGMAFYLSCVESATGKFLWEKPIYSPMPNLPVTALEEPIQE